MSDKPASRNQVRYAVIGAGHLSQVAILPAFANTDNSRLVALLSGDPKKRQALASKYHLDRVYAYDQYEQCLADGVDAAYIVLPNHLHKQYVIRAAQAGVHVLCEKPMAVTSRDCEEMIEAAAQAKVKLMIAYRLHFEESNLEAVELAEKGMLGNLRIFVSTFTQQVAEGNVRLVHPVEEGGGPVYDMGVYCINAARYVFRSEPSEVFAVTATGDGPRFQTAGEMASVVLRFPDDRLANFTCSFGAADVSRYSLIGSKGVLTADPAYEYAIPLRHQLTVDGKTTVLEYPQRDQFAAELIYFSDCILNNKEPEPSGLEGLADVRVVEAVYKSAATGKVVNLAAIRQKRRPELEQAINRPAHAKPKTVNAKSPSGEAA